jgi:hypothetical protein
VSAVLIAGFEKKPDLVESSIPQQPLNGYKIKLIKKRKK